MNKQDLTALAVLTALEKEIKKQLDSRNPDSIRGRIETEMKAEYAETGTDRKRLPVDGAKPSYLTLVIEGAHTESIGYIEDTEALTEWLSNDGREVFKRWLSLAPKDLLDMLIEYAHDTGEIPEGMSMYEQDIPEHVKYARVVGCNYQDVVKTYTSLPDLLKDIPLLGSGEHE